MQELAAASRNNALDHLHTVTEDIQRRGTVVKVSQYKDIRNLLSNRTGSSEELPWQRAAHAAGMARDVWGLPAGPVPNGELSEIFGFHPQDHQPGERSNAQGLPFHAGLQDDKIEDGFLVSLDQRNIDSRRFTLVRLAADYLDTEGDSPLLPATRAGTSRQKFQRAFAQEFLCPIENLKEFLEGPSINDDDINEAAAYFEVSPLTIRTTLVNRGHLAGEQVFGEWAV